MRWILAIVAVLGLAAAGAALYYEKHELPDVVWEDDSPYCPFCRTDVNWYATVCYTCRREFAWRPHERDCPYCLSRGEVRRIRDRYDADPDLYRKNLEEKLRELGMPPDVVAATVPDLVLHVKELKPGACLFCAGTGRWLAPALLQTLTEESDPLLNLALSELDGGCPVCLGTGDCIGCDGDRKTEMGSEPARRAMDRAFDALEDIDAGRDDESAREFFEMALRCVRDAIGTMEVSDAHSIYSTDHDQADWASVRFELVQSALPDGE